MAVAGDPRGYYRALGVERTASADDIKTAFRRRAKNLHPDRGGGAAGKEAFRLLLEAYEALRDPQQRLRYDTESLAAERSVRTRWAGASTTAAAPPAPDDWRRRSASSCPGLREGRTRPHCWPARCALPLILAVLGWVRAVERDRAIARVDPAARSGSAAPAGGVGTGCRPAAALSHRVPLPRRGRRARCRGARPVGGGHRRSAPPDRRPAQRQRLAGRRRGRDRARGRRRRPAGRGLGTGPAAGGRHRAISGRAGHSGRAGVGALPCRRPARRRRVAASRMAWR